MLARGFHAHDLYLGLCGQLSLMRSYHHCSVNTTHEPSDQLREPTVGRRGFSH